MIQMSTGIQDRTSLLGLESWAEWDLKKPGWDFPKRTQTRSILGEISRDSSSGHQARMEGTLKSNMVLPSSGKVQGKCTLQEGFRPTSAL